MNLGGLIGGGPLRALLLDLDDTPFDWLAPAAHQIHSVAALEALCGAAGARA